MLYTMENSEIVDVSALPLKGGDRVSSAYANNADIAISPWDIRIVFTELVGNIGEPEPLSKELRANIVMAPAHAKALVAALLTGVRQYEQVYGDIKMPEGRGAKTEAAGSDGGNKQ